MSNAGIGLLIIRELVRAWKFRLSNYNKGFGRFQQRCHGMLYDMKSGDRHNIIFQMYKPPVLVENSFDGFMDTSIGHLPTSCRGRCQQKDPVVRAVDSPLLKPSRPGEVQIKTDFVGRAVHRWFQQLRRLQSMVHAKNADKNTPAVEGHQEIEGL